MQNDIFHYYLPVNLIFGSGKTETLGEETVKYGKKVMIVTGKHSTKKSGLLARAKSLLEKSGAEVAVFDEAEANPLASTVMKGAAKAKESGAEVIVGIGGGSIMDCSKAIAFAACNEGNIFDYIYGKKTGDEALPLILVPTTCGTGSEGNSFAVLTDDETKDKKSLRNNSVIAKASIVDPELMKTMPRHVLASVGFDALCHCMEAYLSKACSPITELLALEGIRLIGENLVNVYEDYKDAEGWRDITFASTLGGMVINQAGVTAPHGLEHPASGLKNITHGRGLAALTPVIYSRSIENAPVKFAKISQLLGGKDEKDCVKVINRMLGWLDLKTSLVREGVSVSDVEWMTENAFKVSLVSIRNHPKVFTKEEVREIYKEAMG